MSVQESQPSVQDVLAKTPSSTLGKVDQANVIDIVCGDKRATYLIRENRVIFEDQLITPTEFEKIGGRSATKKWKSSLRIIRDGIDKGPIGNWLLANNIHLEPYRNPLKTRKSDKDGSLNSQPVQGPRLAERHSNVSAAELLAHLEKQYLGLRAGDATIGELPETCTLQADLVEVDLRTVSEADLDQMCAASCENPLQDMLTEQPGVLENRVGHFTGYRPMRKAATAAQATPFIGDKAEVNAAFALYLQGKGSLPSQIKVPIVGGKPLNLQKLWQEVSAMGGYKRCTAAKQWSQVVNSLEIDTNVATNASYTIRTLYQKWLLDREEQLLDNRHIRLLGRENYPEAEEERSEAKRQRIEASVDPSSGKSELVQDKFSDSSDSEAKVEKLVGEI